MSDTNFSKQTTKKSNKAVLIAFLAVDVILIGMIALAFNFNPSSSNNSVAVNDVASTTSIVPIVNSIITVETQPTLTGTAPANSKLKIGFAGVYYDTNSNAQGEWEVKTTKDLEPAVYDVRLEIYDNTGSLAGTDSTTDEINIIANASLTNDAASASVSTVSSSADTLAANFGDSNVLVSSVMTSPAPSTTGVVSVPVSSTPATVVPTATGGTNSNLARTGGLDTRILTLSLLFVVFNCIALLAIKKNQQTARLD